MHDSYDSRMPFRIYARAVRYSSNLHYRAAERRVVMLGRCYTYIRRLLSGLTLSRYAEPIDDHVVKPAMPRAAFRRTRC